MKQLTNNKSSKIESCQKGWKLFSIICTYFKSTELLKPYIFKYLETNAYDIKRNYFCKFNLIMYTFELNLIIF